MATRLIYSVREPEELAYGMNDLPRDDFQKRGNTFRIEMKHLTLTITPLIGSYNPIAPKNPPEGARSSALFIDDHEGGPDPSAFCKMGEDYYYKLLDIIGPCTVWDPSTERSQKYDGVSLEAYQL